MAINYKIIGALALLLVPLVSATSFTPLKAFPEGEAVQPEPLYNPVAENDCGPLYFQPTIACTNSAHIGNRECQAVANYACWARCISNADGSGVEILRGPCASSACSGAVNCKTSAAMVFGQ